MRKSPEMSTYPVCNSKLLKFKQAAEFLNIVLNSGEIIFDESSFNRGIFQMEELFEIILMARMLPKLFYHCQLKDYQTKNLKAIPAVNPSVIKLKLIIF